MNIDYNLEEIERRGYQRGLHDALEAIRKEGTPFRSDTDQEIGWAEAYGTFVNRIIALKTGPQ